MYGTNRYSIIATLDAATVLIVRNVDDKQAIVRRKWLKPLGTEPPYDTQFVPKSNSAKIRLESMVTWRDKQ